MSDQDRWMCSLCFLVTHHFFSSTVCNKCCDAGWENKLLLYCRNKFNFRLIGQRQLWKFALIFGSFILSSFRLLRSCLTELSKTWSYAENLHEVGTKGSCSDPIVLSKVNAIGTGARNDNVFQPLAKKLIKSIVTKFKEEAYFNMVVNSSMFPKASYLCHYEMCSSKMGHLLPGNILLFASMILLLLMI